MEKYPGTVSSKTAISLRLKEEFLRLPEEGEAEHTADVTSCVVNACRNGNLLHVSGIMKHAIRVTIKIERFVSNYGLFICISPVHECHMFLHRHGERERARTGEREDTHRQTLVNFCNWSTGRERRSSGGTHARPCLKQASSCCQLLPL